MNNDKRSNVDWFLIFTIVGASLFYLPFISRNFMGDDWLGLAIGQKALSNPTIWFGRSMYGYFRPFSLIVVSLLYWLVGANSYIFGAVNIVLHCANIFLLSEVLKRFNLKVAVRNVSIFIFAFYFLNAPAVEWISAGGELRITFLLLLFVLQIMRLCQEPSLGRFMVALLMATAALLTKESGFTALGLYFLVLLLLGRSPVIGKYRLYTSILVATFMGYLVFYFLTRIYIDKPLEIGPQIIVNLWYFTTYMFFPVAKRIVIAAPDSLLQALKIFRILITISILPLTYLIIRRAHIAVKLFGAWAILSISTIAILKWNISLFALYPETTASRFFYSANIGGAVILGWILIYVWDKFTAIFSIRRFVTAGLIVGFIAANFGVIYVTSRIHTERQALVNDMIADIGCIATRMANGDTLVILMQKKNNPPELIVESEQHVAAIIYVNFDKQVDVAVVNRPDFTGKDLSIIGRTAILGWDSTSNRLIIPARMQNGNLK